jgi:tRNA(Ile2) C34 agmatinyltransferase TiaS
MNDFTKDQLREISTSLRATSFTPYLSTMFKEESMTLLEKVQFLIDNYCEHKKISFRGDVYGYECKKCGADIHSSQVSDEQHEASMYE